MKNFAIPFSEVFVLLSLLFLVLFAISASTGTLTESAKENEIFKVTIADQDGNYPQNLRFLAIKSGDDSRSILFNEATNCTEYLNPRNQLKVGTIVSVYNPSKARCERYEENSGRHTGQPISVEGSVNWFNDQINFWDSRGFYNSRITLSFPAIENAIFGPQLYFTSEDVPDKLRLQLGFCGSFESTPPGISVVAEKIGSRSVIREFLATYDVNTKSASVISNDVQSSSDIPIAFDNDDCSNHSIRNSLGLLNFELSQKGVALSADL